MTKTDVTAIIAVIISIISAVVALLSRTDSRRSADASESSAEVAKQALNLEKDKFRIESEERERRIKDQFVEKGILFIKNDGYRGFKKWFNSHPELFERDDWYEIVHKAAASLGTNFKNIQNFMEFAKERQIKIPIKE